MIGRYGQNMLSRIPVAIETDEAPVVVARRQCGLHSSWKRINISGPVGPEVAD